jgi:hypothetical protein
VPNQRFFCQTYDLVASAQDKAHLGGLSVTNLRQKSLFDFFHLRQHILGSEHCDF